jgi:hypothetical protein
MFTTLTFQNFRGFEHLRLEGLQGVNLIVGRNNAGKTSLLEGIAMLSDPTHLHEMPGLLRAEVNDDPHSVRRHRSREHEAGRYFRWVIRDRKEVSLGVLTGTLLPKGECKISFYSGNKSPQDLLGTRSFESHSTGTGGTYTIAGGQRVTSLPGLMAVTPEPATVVKCRAVSVRELSYDAQVKVFAQAVKRKGGEERIEHLLSSVDSRFRKVRVEPSDEDIHLVVDLGLSEMLPIGQVGQGMIRLITIFSELVGEQPKVCLIDEIENGIHHSLLEQIWTGLGLAAKELDVQVFATTHSLECIQAAHTAFSSLNSYNFSVVQLFRLDEGIQGRVLDRHHIEAAMAGEIDLR